jgi:hypothetical protein
MGSITIYHEYEEVKSYTDSLVITNLQVVITDNGKKLIYYALPKKNAFPIKALSLLAELARRMLGRRFGRGAI